MNIQRGTYGAAFFFLVVFFFKSVYFLQSCTIGKQSIGLLESNIL